VGILGWIVVGLIAGALANAATGTERRGCLLTMVTGILGGLVGGFLFNAAGGKGIVDFGVWSILVAFVGACALLFVLQALGVLGRRHGPRRR
jgi:uncharacterized membrane protein YeaQ/YmgE (transglycosylase-associated protein family)